MAMPLVVRLSPTERAELVDLRDHGHLPYIRERAAALLKIADGLSGRQVALHGLLKKRDEDAVYRWVHRYQAEGVSGLYIKAGRGRKPAFSP